MARIKTPKGTNTSKGAPKLNMALANKVFGMNTPSKPSKAAQAKALERSDFAPRKGGGGQRRDRKGRFA